MTIQITEIDTKHDGWSKYRVVTVRLADGKTIRREMEDHGSAVAVLPYDPQRRMAVLIRQFRVPVFFATGEEDLVEAVAGVVEQGEDPADCARRETLEEAGLRIDTLEYVATAWTMPGVSTERMALYLAPYRKDDRVTAGGGVDHDEDITVIELPLRELADLVDDGRLPDMKALALAQALRWRHPDLFA
jgi:nudix-type nucleoside diphosphatase (YffH/AdpP family)